jgi:MFS family permease
VLAVGALCLVQFVDVLGVAIVTIALPAILAGLDAPASATPVLVTGYAMFFGGLLLLGARLGDRYGHRRVLLVGLAAFGAASALAGLAQHVPVVIVARCLQGGAAALSVPAALRLLTAVTPDGAARNRALATWSAAGAAAGATGLLLGGVLTDLAGWRSVFWINVPLAALLIVAVWRTAPSTERESSGPLDGLGAGLLTAAVMSVVLGSSLLEDPQRRTPGFVLLAAGVLLTLAFRTVERRALQPVLPRAAFHHRELRVGSGVAFANTATTSSAITLLTLELQDAGGRSATAAGLALLPFSLAVVVGAAVAPRILARRSPSIAAAAGLAAIAAGNAALLVAPAVPWLIPIAVGASGAGIGLSSVASTTQGTAVASELQGTAAGVLNTAAQLGTALGVAAALLLAVSTEGSGLPLAGAPLGYAAAALAAAVSALLALASSRRRAPDAWSGGRAHPGGLAEGRSTVLAQREGLPWGRSRG